jgi:hypothetical protein
MPRTIKKPEQKGWDADYFLEAAKTGTNTAHVAGVLKAGTLSAGFDAWASSPG